MRRRCMSADKSQHQGISKRYIRRRGDEIMLDDSQERFCSSSSDHVRLLAPAGSGKTLSLLWRCKSIAEKSPERNQRFLIFTFTRVARDELQARMNKDESFHEIRKQVRIETLNRWGFNYLRKQVNTSLALKTTNKELFALVKHNLRPIWSRNEKIEKAISGSQRNYVDLIHVVDALKTSGFRHDSPDLMQDFGAQLDLLEECGLLRYFEANILQPLENMGLVKKDVFFNLEQLTPFVSFWRDVCIHLWDSAIITLDDQKYWALLALQRKYSETVFPEPIRYHHIFVDEFQDINPLDLQLVKELVRVNRSTVTIVGDDDQAIFEWRGAVPRFILRPDEFFNTPFETYTLETNYRSPKNILFHSQKLIARNRNRVKKTIRAKINTDAEIIHRYFPCHDDAANFVLDLAREVNRIGTPKGLAILARKKSQLIPLQIMLASEHIPFYAKEDLNVLLSEAFEDLKTILEAVATKHERRSQQEIVNIFLRCCNKVQAYPLRQGDSKPLYGFLMSTRPRTFMHCLDSFLSYTGRLRGEPIDFGIPIAKVMEAKTVTEAIQLIEAQMGGLKKHYAKGEDDIFYKDPPFLHLADYARRYAEDFYSFIDDVAAAIASMMYMPEPDSDSDIIDEGLFSPVHLMTALRAKGKEFHTVIVLDANDGLWPIRFAETEAELEQERRVFYVAITRAQSRLLMLSVEQIAGKRVSLTPYLREMGIAIG